MHNDELTWDELFILQATLIAQKSKDPSTKVGCIIVNDDNVILSTGFNGFPRGIEEDWKDRWKRPETSTGPWLVGLCGWIAAPSGFDCSAAGFFVSGLGHIPSGNRPRRRSESAL